MSKRTAGPDNILDVEILEIPGTKGIKIRRGGPASRGLEVLSALGLVQDYLSDVDDHDAPLVTANGVEEQLRRLLKSHADLLQSLEHLIPYAQSRIEDMGENAAGASPHHRKEARRLYRLASDRFGRALVRVAAGKEFAS